MTTHKVYKIYDNQGMTYIGSTGVSMARRKASHHEDFKNKIDRKLYKYWNSVGWENMKIKIIEDNIETKQKRREIEQEEIKKLPVEKMLNSIKANCLDYEASRSINSGVGEAQKIEAKRKTRMVYYYNKKKDPLWHEKEKERNRLRMREKRTKLKLLGNETTSTTERVCAGEELSNPQ